ncbi:hypothetical protein MERGE_000718 [Pneumocystis wakefieldiae]|uniref:Uncharacterized protein n=1 Tax=Pneumocystis wakefieldiae TaxID=38082 RepID=A0A899FQY3_9ASCO|nr:hypothetical protein MERGE_000718 [Pneumocystis wakefieldiae]
MIFSGNIINDPENRAGEETPLLSNKGGFSRLTSSVRRFVIYLALSILKRMAAFYFISFVAVLSLIGLILYMGRDDISEGYRVSFNEIDVKNVTKEGFNVQVSGLVDVDHSNIKPFITRNLWKGFSQIAGNLRVYGLNLNIYLPDCSQNKVATVILSKIQIDIRDRHHTNFNEMTFSKLDDSLALIELFKHFSEKMFNDVKISGKASFRLRFLHFFIFPVFIGRMTTIYKIPETSLGKMFDMNSLAINDSSSSDFLNAEVQLSTKLDFSISTYLPHLTWNALVPSCDQTKHVKIAEIKSYFFYMESSKTLNITLLSRIMTSNNELVGICNDTGISPLNRMVSDYFSKKDLYIYMIGDIPESSMESYVPSRLLQTLITTEIPVSLHGFSNIKLIKSIKIDKFVMKRNKDGYIYDTLWPPSGFYGIVAVKMQFPGAFDFYINITHIRLNLDLLSDGILFSKVLQDEWVPSTSLRPTHQLIYKKKDSIS